MPTLVKYATHVCEIDRASPNQANTGSCDVGKYSSTTNNCFFNFESLNSQIPAGSTINSASLVLAQVSGGLAATLTSKVSLRKGNWGAFTWNVGPYIACDGVQFTLTGTSAASRTIDVTNIVQWIVDNNSPDHIFRLERVPNDQSGISDAERFSTTPGNHSLQINYTPLAPCGPPTNVTVSPSVAETEATLTWSGATGGGANAITGYEITYSDSSDGSGWSAWQTPAIVPSSSGSGSYTVEPPPTRGHYRRFRIRTRGALGEAYHSGWATSGTLRKNVLSSPPGVFTAAPEVYEGGSITLAWGGVVPGTSAIKSYTLQSASSMDGGVTWTAFASLTTILSSATSGSTAVAADMRDGVKVVYRIRTVDSFDAPSAYVSSNIVSMVTSPPAPAVLAPASGRTAYSAIPRALLKSGAYAGGMQTLHAQVDDGPWYDSTADPARFSVSGLLEGNTASIFMPPPLSLGSHTLTFKAINATTGAESAAVQVQFMVAASPFSVLTANATTIKAAHIQQLRDAANAVRRYYGLSVQPWKETVVGGKTPIWRWPLHITEIRSAVDDIVSVINSHDASGAFDVPPVGWLPFLPGRPRADLMRQIQDLILTL
ncbi:MAG: fibronectin type III domain-containing protein [Candidatus Pelethousia sp.]|nr:fibronectin type III domain-containing protein [Candidatus Pelethousia sp.]